MISSLAQLRAGLQPIQYYAKASRTGGTTGNFLSYWGTTGFPATGNYDTTLNGVILVAPQVGQIPFFDPPIGQEARLARFKGVAAVSAQSGVAFVMDRIWHNGGISITSTGVQAIASPTWPARDSEGSTAGRGILIAAEVQTATGAVSGATLTYTNSQGVAGRTADFVVPAIGNLGSFNDFALASGDEGVRSVQSIQLASSWVSGAINLVAYRIIESLPFRIPTTNHFLDGAMSAPRLYNGSVPFMAYAGSSGATAAAGELQFSWG
jgi:hypothetical protein